LTTRTIRTEEDYDRLCVFLSERKKPFTITVEDGVRRSTDQNRLAFLWYNEISQQLDGWTVEDARAYCKLVVGVPLLRAENEHFREKYDKIIKPLPYETKLELMSEPVEFPVTSLMTVKQMIEYLNGIQQHWSGHGVLLTDPEGILEEAHHD
jgi:hypothetical protein